MATSADTLTRTNERPGTRAKLSNLGTSAYKVREVLNLIRGQQVGRAQEILRFCDRGPATPVSKLLSSAVANATNNDGLDADELFIAACFADEGATAKRWRPRARGRAGRIRKRSSHVTIIVSRLPEDQLERLRKEQEKVEGSRRSRVAGSRAARTAASKKKDAENATAAVEEEVTDTEKTEATELAAAKVIAENAPEESGTTPASATDVDETPGAAGTEATAEESTKTETPKGSGPAADKDEK
jgi:large subunit ribosomal protein L22